MTMRRALGLLALLCLGAGDDGDTLISPRLPLEAGATTLGKVTLAVQIWKKPGAAKNIPIKYDVVKIVRRCLDGCIES